MHGATIKIISFVETLRKTWKSTESQDVVKTSH